MNDVTLDGVTEVSWAVRMGRIYVMTGDATLRQLVVEPGITLAGCGHLTCDTIVNYGTIIAIVDDVGEINNWGSIDPRSMARWS